MFVIRIRRSNTEHVPIFAGLVQSSSETPDSVRRTPRCASQQRELQDHGGRCRGLWRGRSKTKIQETKPAGTPISAPCDPRSVPECVTGAAAVGRPQARSVDLGG